MGTSFLVVVVVVAVRTSSTTTTTPGIRSGTIHNRSVSMCISIHISTRRGGFQCIPSIGNWNRFGFDGRVVVAVVVVVVVILGVSISGTGTSLVGTLAISIVTVSLLFRSAIAIAIIVGS